MDATLDDLKARLATLEQQAKQLKRDIETREGEMVAQNIRTHCQNGREHSWRPLKCATSIREDHFFLRTSRSAEFVCYCGATMSVKDLD